MLPLADGPRGIPVPDLVGTSHGLRIANAAWSSPRGRPGGWASLALDGTGDQITVPHKAALNVAAGNFTLSCWFYATAFGSYKSVVTKDTNPAARELGFFIDTTTGGGFNVGTGAFVPATFSPAYTTGAWQWWCWTRTAGATNNTFYRNGIQNAVDNNPGGWGTTVNALDLVWGGDPSAGGTAWNGWLDDMRVMNRGWSADEVLLYYALSKRGYPGLLRRVAGTARRPPAVVAGTAMLVHPGMHARMAEMTGRLVA
jgi:hypothetical protein